MPEVNCGEKGLVGSISIPNLGSGLSAVLIKILPIKGEPQSYTLSAANPTVSLIGSGPLTWQAWAELAKTYVNYGIDHILLGADHLLFVLGLIWIVRGGWKLAKTITAFTVGHSVSLALATFGLIGLPRDSAQCMHRAQHRVRRRRDREAAAWRDRSDRALSVGRRLWLRSGAWHRLRRRVGGARTRTPPAAVSTAFLQYRRRNRTARVRAAGAGFDVGASAAEGGVAAVGGDVLPAYAIGAVSMFWFIGRLVRVFTIA